MPDDLAPDTPELPSAAAMPDIEKLADSEDSDVIEARAKLLKAQAALAKAQTPLLDKVILRGLIPIALAIAGPWAIYKFDKAQNEQVQTTTELKGLLEAAKDDEAARQTRSVVWRERMKEIEDERTAELTAMSAMVCRLDDTMKMAMVQAAVARLVNLPTQVTQTSPQIPPSRNEVQQDISAQIQLPGTPNEEVDRLAGQAYDRIMEHRMKKGRK